MKIFMRIILVILLAVVIVGGYFLTTAFLIGPKDLGVEYTAKDLQRISEAIGGDRVYPSDMSESSDIFEDYNLNYSDPKAYNLEITPEELGAIIAEILPPAFPVKDLQMIIHDDGTVEVSCRANLEVLVNHFFSDVADDIPIPVPKNANVYFKGKVTTLNGVSTVDIESAKIGALGIPQKYLTPENQQSIARYADRFQTAAPGVVIRELSFDNNKIYFDGDFPDSYYITDK